MSKFPALDGFYQLFFLYLEPFSTVLPALMAWIYPGTAWFHHQLIPSTYPPPKSLDPRSTMLVSQLGNCYFLLGLVSSLVFRGARDALKSDPVSQERIVGALFTALAIADVSHIIATLVCLPSDIQFQPLAWNSMTHGNITFVVVLFAARISWFLGIGRKRYYYGQSGVKDKTT